MASMRQSNLSAIEFLFDGPVEGVLDARLEVIHTELESSKGKRRLDKRETDLLLEYLEGLSFKERWDEVVEWSSSAILGGCSFSSAAEVYRFWCEGLARSHDPEGLSRLARHLLHFRRETDEFLALALYCLVRAGRARYAKALAKDLFKRKKKSLLVAEALLTYNLSFLARPRREQSLRLLGEMLRKYPRRYFTLLNWMESAFYEDDHDAAAEALNLLHKCFPSAPEPYYTAAALGADGGNWYEATQALQELVRVDPLNGEHQIGLASALEYTGELAQAWDVIKSAQSLVDPDDHDLLATRASLAFKMWKQNKLEEYRREAIRALGRLLEVGKAYNIPRGGYYAMLHELRAGVGELLIAGQNVPGRRMRFWMAVTGDYGWKRVLPRQSFLVRVAPEMAKGDVIFLTRGEVLEGQKVVEVEGLLEILTPQVPDERLEAIVKVGNFKFFEEPVVFHFNEPALHLHDGHGLHNFSTLSNLYYVEIAQSSAEEIVASVESLGSEFLRSRMKNYA